MNTEYSNIAKNYKRKVAGGFMLVDGAKILEKIGGEDFLVTKKLDGEMTLLFFDEGGVSAFNSRGRQLDVELPCFAEFGKLCQAAGLKSAQVAAELYAVVSDDGRERVHDVKASIAAGELDKLKLAPFDIIQLDGEAFVADHFKETFAKIKALFSGILVKPVECKTAASKGEVEQIFKTWCEEGGAEGVVLHSELPFVYKIKPRHTIDAVVVGYTVSDDGGVRDLMVAVMREDGALQTIGVTGNGFTAAESQTYFNRLSAMHVASEFIETDSRNIAFQMVRPEIVLEISAVDFVAEDSKGEAKMNPLISYDEAAGYKVVARTPGVAAHSLVVVRERNDKACNAVDIRISQITDICPFSEGKTLSLTDMPKSEQMLRRIFVKGEGPKLMIQKYVVWKTNKEATGLYPAYVFHYTDFSVGRKEPLKRDIRVSNSQEQILQLCDEFIAANVKKGWNEQI